MSEKHKILWADDEIEHLQSHIIFLRDKGYDITSTTNADDAIALIKNQKFDLLLLDEMMPGKDGLTTLNEIKEISPNLPVIMITKSEEEKLMEDAIGGKIDDYLTKPVNPSQILMACKKILEGRKITGEQISRNYTIQFSEISRKLMEALTPKDWMDIHLKLTEWEIELDHRPDLGLEQMLFDQRKECNVEFGKFVEKSYRAWIHGSLEAPLFSPEVVKTFILPEILAGKNILFVVIDCLRFDQWLTFETSLQDFYDITREPYFAILPTATPYSRNALFAGMYPSEIEKKYPDLWQKGNYDDYSRNRYESQFMLDQLQRYHAPLKSEPKYIKILDANEGMNVARKISSYFSSSFVSLVINFVDILTHSRSEVPVLKEIAPNESAFRSLTRSWFEHSSLYQILKSYSETDTTVFITTDHGSIRGMKGTKVIADKEASTSLRYKYGTNLKVDLKHAIYVKNPADFNLPSHGIASNYIIAKEDYYFVYPTNYNHYLNYYKDSFQHGGVSLEEMIVPLVKLRPRRTS